MVKPAALSCADAPEDLDNRRYNLRLAPTAGDAALHSSAVVAKRRGRGGQRAVVWSDRVILAPGSCGAARLSRSQAWKG